MNIYILLGVLGFSLLFPFKAKAQEDKLSVSPTARILMDGALYNSNNEDLVDGVAIPDLRIGAKASYGRYKAKLDIGYSYGKVSLKDVFAEGKLSSSSLLRVGYFDHQFGLQGTTSSSMKTTLEEPASQSAFFNARLIGAMYIYEKNHLFAAASVHVENEAIKQTSDQLGKQGYGAMTRLVYRPLRNEGTIFHLGISGGYESPRYNNIEELNHSSYVLGSYYPTRVARVKSLNATVTEAKHLYKFTPEILAAYGPIGLEAQYYYLSIERKEGFKNYNASGAYGILRGLILGGNYKYSNADSSLATPVPKSLECVLAYNYTDLSDKEASIYGGRLNDVSLTANYYINKYMIARLRYSYTKTTNRILFENQTLNAIQARFQIIF